MLSDLKRNILEKSAYERTAEERQMSIMLIVTSFYQRKSQSHRFFFPYSEIRSQ